VAVLQVECNPAVIHRDLKVEIRERKKERKKEID
jgi:hypothetical protein